MRGWSVKLGDLGFINPVEKYPYRFSGTEGKTPKCSWLSLYRKFHLRSHKRFCVLHLGTAPKDQTSASQASLPHIGPRPVPAQKRGTQGCQFATCCSLLILPLSSLGPPGTWASPCHCKAAFCRSNMTIALSLFKLCASHISQIPH